MTDSLDIRMTTTTQTSAISGPSNSSSLSYQRLPSELVLDICERAAYAFPECIPNLILVAHRFRIWFEPKLYRTIVSRSGKFFFPPLYLEQPEESESNSDTNPDSLCRVLDKERIMSFGHHVQDIWLWKKTPTEIAGILECCPKVFSLTLWKIKGGAWDLIPILENLPLRRLSIDPSDLFPDYSIDDGIPFSHPVFLNLTHIQVIWSASSWSQLKQLGLLPNLTHLALYLHDINQGLIDRILEECRTLELLLVNYNDLESIVTVLETPQDDRVVLFEFADIETDLREWEGSHPGCSRKDFWTRAQAIKVEATQACQCNAALHATTGQT